MGLVRIKWGLDPKVSNPCPVLFSTISSCFLKQQTIILYLATFPVIIWSLSQTLISIIHWCFHEGQSSDHICMFPEWKGNSREALTFAVDIRPQCPGACTLKQVCWHYSSMEESWPFLREANTSSWQCWAFYSLCKLFYLGRGRTDPLSQSGIITGVEVKYILKEEQKQPKHSSICCCSVAPSCPNLCNPIGCSMPGFSLLHYLPEFAQTHVHWISDAIQPSHSLSPPSHKTILGLLSESLIQDTERVTCLPSSPWIPSYTMPLSNLNHLVLWPADLEHSSSVLPNLASSALGLLCTAHQIQSNT